MQAPSSSTHLERSSVHFTNRKPTFPHRPNAHPSFATAVIVHVQRLHPIVGHQILYDVGGNYYVLEPDCGSYPPEVGVVSECGR